MEDSALVTYILINPLAHNRCILSKNVNVSEGQLLNKDPGIETLVKLPLKNSAYLHKPVAIFICCIFNGITGTSYMPG